MKNIKVFLLFMVSITFAIIISGCSSEEASNNNSESKEGTSDTEETINWDFMIFVGLEHPMGEWALEFAEKVKEKTDGRLNITVRPAGELPYKANEYLRTTSTNNVQVADACLCFVSGDLEVGSIPNLPFLNTDVEELETVLEVIRPYLDEELEKYNAKLLYTYPWSPVYVFSSGDMISSYKDLKGMKVRANSPEESFVYNAIGASPVTIATPEVPQAIDRGLVDAISTSPLTTLGSKWYDFVDYGYRTDIMIYPSYIVVNKDEYDQLPEDLQSIVDEVSAEVQQKFHQEMMVINNESASTLENEHGMEFGGLSEEEKAELTELSVDYWNEWAEDKGPKTVEALKMVREKLDK